MEDGWHEGKDSTMEQLYRTETLIVREALADVGPDYAAILGFELPKNGNGRTTPELAYKAMREALDGLTPSEMRKLAPVISRWKKLSPRGRRLLDDCLFRVMLTMEDEERELRRKCAAKNGIVLDFKKCRARVRYLKMRGER